MNLSSELATVNQNIATLESQKTDLENQLAIANQDKDAYANEIESLQGVIASLNTTLGDFITTADELQAQLTEAFSDLSEANTQISLLESQWSNANTTIESLLSSWGAANQTIAQLDSGWSDANQTISQLQTCVLLPMPIQPSLNYKPVGLMQIKRLPHLQVN